MRLRHNLARDVSRACTCATSRRAVSGPYATREAGADDGARPRDGAPRAGARAKAKLKVRQPCARRSWSRTARAGGDRAARGGVREELNVSEIRFVAAAEELGRYEVKANYRTLGPVFGKDMPRAAEAIAALDPAK